MNAKRNVLKISSVYIVYLIILLLISTNCHSDWCNIQEDDVFGLILFFFAPLIPVFIFSLITYRMKNEVFRSWWNFARWWAPVIIVVTLLLENANKGGGMGIGGAVSGGFDIFVISIFYIILVITSLIKITRAHFRTRETRKS